MKFSLCRHFFPSGNGLGYQSFMRHILASHTNSLVGAVSSPFKSLTFSRQQLFSIRGLSAGRVRPPVHARSAEGHRTERNPIVTILKDRLPMLGLADDGQENKLALILRRRIEKEYPNTKDYIVGVVRSTTFTFADLNNIEIAESTVEEFAKEVASALQRDSNIDGDPIMDRPAELTLGLSLDRIGVFDLEQFSQRVEETFRWHDRGHETYVSPSFAIIQSSGMGKTKLMKDYRNLFMQNNNGSNIFVQLILCHNSQTSLPETFEKHFDHNLEIPPTILISEDAHHDTKNEDRNKNINARDQVLRKLNEIISMTDSRHIVLLFDESHCLVQGDAEIYVSIRWWLRQVRKKQIVAVFAGTLVSLANYQRTQPPLGWTRDARPQYKNDDGSQHVEPKMLYTPFYALTTTGLERIKRSWDAEEWNRATAAVDDQLFDIRRHGYFGRPLFAAMLKPLPGETKSSLYLSKDCVQGNCITSDKLYAIVRRMLQLDGPSENWFEDSRKGKHDAIASILAIRIHMGMASYDFVKNATSKGYAYLVHCSTHDETKLLGRGFGVAGIEYPPEPICAAMAMGLMRPQWEIAKQFNGFAITGVNPRKWVEAIGEIFDQEIFLPNRGNAGEIFAALYLLLCGDALRREREIISCESLR